MAIRTTVKAAPLDKVQQKKSEQISQPLNPVQPAIAQCTDTNTALAANCEALPTNDHAIKLESPLLLLDSRKYPTSDLTEFNFRILDDKQLQNGKNYKARLMRSATDFIDIEFRARIKGEGIVRCRFTDLSNDTRKSLSAFVNGDNGGGRGDSLNQLTYDQIAKGDMEKPEAQPDTASATSAATTNAKPAKAEADAKDGASQRIKLLAAVMLIAAITTIFLIVGAFISARNSIGIKHAALVGNFLPVQSHTEGFVSDVFVTEGQFVNAGDALFQIQDKATETDVAFAQADLLEARAAESALRSQVKNHHKKLEIVADNLQQQILGAQAELKKARIESRAQSTLLDSKRKLFERGLLSNQEISVAASKNEVMKADIDSKRADVGMLQVAYRATTENGIIAIGDTLDDELGQLKADLMVAEANVDRAEAQLNVVSDHSLMVKAPTDGRVYAVYRQNGEFVKQADNILSVSLNNNYWASGSVSSAEADRIRPGQMVKVKIPSLDVEVVGEVAAVGHRGLYTNGGWSQDFRAAALDVPIKVRLPSMPADVPSGLRLQMSVDLGFKWPWQKNQPETTEIDGIIANPETKPNVNAVNKAEQATVAIESTDKIAPGIFASQDLDNRSWEQNLSNALNTELQGIDDAVVTAHDDGSLNIKLSSTLGFRSGSAQLSPAGETALAAIGDILANHKDAHIRVSGHTDSLQPGRASGFKTNQSLSAARAQAVMAYLNEESAIPEYRTSAVGQADRFPVASNESVNGRKQNRRIEFDLTRRFPDQTASLPLP